jgi:LacI family transcriptional regulator
MAENTADESRPAGTSAPAQHSASASRTSPATLEDVAREAGVSLATASRSLNGSSRTVNEKYRSKVLDAAARLNYSPNLSAQAVARGSTMTVALVVADISDPYFSSIAAGVVAEADRERLIVTMAASERDSRRELEIVRTLRGQRPKVIILAGSRRENDPSEADLRRELDDYERAGGRVVIISRNELGFRTVDIDNTEGADDLATTLVDLGYREFAVLAGNLELKTAADRYAGFVAALARHGIRMPPDRVVGSAFTRDGGHDGMRTLIERGLDDVEVVFAVNDVMAVGALSAMREAALEPGVDAAIAGFDDIPTVQDVWPTLTTVRVPLVEVGRSALRLALEDRPGEDSAVRTSVVVRDSTPEFRARSR